MLRIVLAGCLFACGQTDAPRAEAPLAAEQIAIAETGDVWCRIAERGVVDCAFDVEACVPGSSADAPAECEQHSGWTIGAAHASHIVASSVAADEPVFCTSRGSYLHCWNARVGVARDLPDDLPESFHREPLPRTTVIARRPVPQPTRRTAVRGQASGTIRELATTRAGVCALTDEMVECWPMGGAADPNEIAVPAGFRGLAGGLRHMCGIAGGRVSCWGDNAAGQLGEGARPDQEGPFVVPGVEGATALALTNEASCALRSNGTVMCWGPTHAIGVDLGTECTTGDVQECSRRPRGPTAVAGISSAIAIASSHANVCALDRTGAITCWGNGDAPVRLARVDLEDATRAELAVNGVGPTRLHACVLIGARFGCWNGERWDFAPIRERAYDRERAIARPAGSTVQLPEGDPHHHH